MRILRVWTENSCYNIKLIREYRVGKYWGDGFDKETKTIYEYFGCRWHGCECAFKKDRDIPNIFTRDGYKCADLLKFNTLAKLHYYSEKI